MGKQTKRKSEKTDICDKIIAHPVNFIVFWKKDKRHMSLFIRFFKYLL